MTIDLVAFRRFEAIEPLEQAHLVLAAFEGDDPGALPRFDDEALVSLLRLRLPALVRYADEAWGVAQGDGTEAAAAGVVGVTLAWVEDDGDLGLQIKVADFAVGLRLPIDGEVKERTVAAIARLVRVLQSDAGLFVFDPHAEQAVEFDDGDDEAH